mmetsp:Transcript_52546/g.112380  ORF Transcript_52546/g.112380 Transcript_52546/m.112380 type:complete len:242 (-) Transcript_52546:708-1433(-)
MLPAADVVFELGASVALTPISAGAPSSFSLSLITTVMVSSSSCFSCSFTSKPLCSSFSFSPSSVFSSVCSMVSAFTALSSVSCFASACFIAPAFPFSSFSCSSSACSAASAFTASAFTASSSSSLSLSLSLSFSSRFSSACSIVLAFTASFSFSFFSPSFFLLSSVSSSKRALAEGTTALVLSVFAKDADGTAVLPALTWPGCIPTSTTEPALEGRLVAENGFVRVQTGSPRAPKSLPREP